MRFKTLMMMALCAGLLAFYLSRMLINNESVSVNDQMAQDDGDSIAQDPNQNAPNKQLESSVNSDASQTTQRQEPDTDEIDAFAAQFDERRYSDQLQVELASVTLNMITCDKGQMRFSSTDDNDTRAVLQILQSKLDNKCDQLREQYPLLQSDVTGLNSNFLKYHVQGGLVETLQVLSVVKYKEDIGPAFLKIIQDIQKQKNGQMLNMAIMMAAMNPALLANEKNLLGGIDQRYLEEIQAITLTQLSCPYQQGETCSETGAFMLRQCRASSEACGLNFDAWYAQFTTDAMKADVDLMLAFYRN